MSSNNGRALAAFLICLGIQGLSAQSNASIPGRDVYIRAMDDFFNEARSNAEIKEALECLEGKPVPNSLLSKATNMAGIILEQGRVALPGKGKEKAKELTRGAGIGQIVGPGHGPSPEEEGKVLRYHG